MRLVVDSYPVTQAYLSTRLAVVVSLDVKQAGRIVESYVTGSASLIREMSFSKVPDK